MKAMSVGHYPYSGERHTIVTTTGWIHIYPDFLDADRVFFDQRDQCGNVHLAWLSVSDYMELTYPDSLPSVREIAAMLADYMDDAKAASAEDFDPWEIPGLECRLTWEGPVNNRIGPPHWGFLTGDPCFDRYHGTYCADCVLTGEETQDDLLETASAMREEILTQWAENGYKLGF